MHKHIKNYRGAPGGISLLGKTSAIIFIGGKYRNFEKTSCAIPVPIAHKLVGIIRIRGEMLKDLTC